MLNGKIKKGITIVLATMSIIGNNYTPVQARTVNSEPIAKVIDCNDLTLEMITTRCAEEKHIMYIEKVVGIVADDEGNGIILNNPEDCGYYISYRSVKGARKGDLIITYCVYNPYTNWDDDVIERWDFIQ